MSKELSGNTGKNPRPKKKKKKVSFFRVFLLSMLILFIVGTASIMGLVFGVIKTAKPIDAQNIQSMLDESSFIYDQDKNLIEKVHGSSFRSIVPLEKIPTDLQHAIIAIEDERFYKHPGIDVKRIAGALWYDLRTMSKAQGASTLTQQLAKNIYTSPEKSISRKIKDMYYAIELEKHLTKDQILHAYLNTAFMGRDAVGVQAAAQTYFAKNVEDLTLPESAMIAGITKFPTKYSPYVSAKLDGSEDLQNTEILVFPITEGIDLATDTERNSYDTLLKYGKIDKFQYSQLKKGDLYIRKAVLNPNAIDRQHVVLGKMKQLGYITESQYTEAINAPITIKIGKKKETGISSYFNDLLKKQVVDALMQKGYTEDEATDILYNGGLRIYSTMDMRIQKILEKEYENSRNFPGSFTDENGIPQPQSAMVIMDQHTGEVKGLVGGRMIGGSKIFNRAINPRQPGSAIKPLAVYIPALDSGMTAATVFEDKPRPDGKGGYWPKNVGSYRGAQTIRDLVKHSSNVGAVKVAESLSSSESSSINTMIQYLQKMGFTTLVTRSQNPRHNDENLSLTLGGMTRGLTPLEMTAAYSAIANNGTYIKPVLFTKIENNTGEIILEIPKSKKKIVDPAVAYVMTDIMRSVVTEGSGRVAAIPGMNVVGKTGTTSDKKDAWFVGYSPYYTAATWIGSDMPRPLSDGSKLSAKLWQKVMTQVHEGLPKKDFQRPSGVSTQTICTVSGKIATDSCRAAGTTRTEVFVSGTQPKSSCSVHNGSSVEEEPLDPNAVDPNNPDLTDPNNPDLTNPDGGTSTPNPDTGGSTSPNTNKPSTNKPTTPTDNTNTNTNTNTNNQPPPSIF